MIRTNLAIFKQEIFTIIIRNVSVIFGCNFLKNILGKTGLLEIELQLLVVLLK